MIILVTGAAGFIGYHVANRLINEGKTVVGIDNVNSYYDTQLKKDRLKQLQGKKGFTFFELDISDKARLEDLFNTFKVDKVIHLAAQAGVRYSLQNPQAYIDSNVTGFTNLLEVCRSNSVKHFLYASSSSVYGANQKVPFSVDDPVNHPVSLYAATKKANELLAHTYSHLYGLPTTGIRLFTVYGPWGRPDMAYFSFAKSIYEGNPIKVFNYGKMKRDFTYIDDVVEAIAKLIEREADANPKWNPEDPKPSSSYAPYKLYNIGNQNPVELSRFIETLETLIGIKANIEYLPMQAGDVKATFADVESLKKDIGFVPSTPLHKGLEKFVVWFKEYYR